jgi:hypothetical protein
MGWKLLLKKRGELRVHFKIREERALVAHSSRVVGRLCGWEAVAECSEGRSEGLVRTGPLWGHLRASSGRWTRWRELLLFLPFFLLTAQVSPQHRAESGERFEGARGGLVKGWTAVGTSSRSWRSLDEEVTASYSSFSLLTA